MGSDLDDNRRSVRITVQHAVFPDTWSAEDTQIPLFDAIERLTECLSLVPDEYKHSAKLIIHLCEEDLGGGVETRVTYDRPETEAEKAYRLRKEAAKARAEQEQERAEYERLRAKYEGL